MYLHLVMGVLALDSAPLYTVVLYYCIKNEKMKLKKKGNGVLALDSAPLYTVARE